MSETPIQRYEVEEVCRGMDCYSVMRKNPDGDYVMHDDHVAQLTAANARIADLEKDQSPRFHVPNALLEDYWRYITELPPCEIVADGILVSKDVLIELVNALKNGMTKDLNAALVANKEMEAQLASAREDGEKLESQRDEALSTLQHIADRKDSMGVTVLYLGSVAKTTADRLRSALNKSRGVFGHLAGRTSPPASAEPGAAPTHRWSYSSYKATLYCDGKPWAIVSPDGRNALSAADASLLELAMNSMTLPPPTRAGMKPFPKRDYLKVIRAALPNIQVQDHPYDVGYWARRAGFSKPKGKEESEGWTDADNEIAEENA